MNSTQPAMTLGEARAAADRAELIEGRRRGELVAAVQRCRLEVPATVSNALDRFELAEDAARFAREQVSHVRSGTLTADERRTRLQGARISALIAAHVMGFRLSRDGSELTPWRSVDQTGKHRELPNYVGDINATRHAEQMLRPEQLTQYGQILAGAVGANFGNVATANAYVRALSILRAIGVNPTDEPPTLAR